MSSWWHLMLFEIQQHLDVWSVGFLTKFSWMSIFLLYLQHFWFIWRIFQLFETFFSIKFSSVPSEIDKKCFRNVFLMGILKSPPDGAFAWLAGCFWQFDAKPNIKSNVHSSHAYFSAIVGIWTWDCRENLVNKDCLSRSQRTEATCIVRNRICIEFS